MTPFTYEPESYREYEIWLDSLYERQIDREIQAAIEREENDKKIQSNNGSDCNKGRWDSVLKKFLKQHQSNDTP